MKKKLSVLFLSVMLLLTGCGGGDSDGSRENENKTPNVLFVAKKNDAPNLVGGTENYLVVTVTGETYCCTNQTVDIFSESFSDDFGAGRYSTIFAKLSLSDSTLKDSYKVVADSFKNSDDTITFAEISPDVMDDCAYSYYVMTDKGLKIFYSLGNNSGVNRYSTNEQVLEISQKLHSDFGMYM